jgi:hypothetical protein
VDRALGPQSAAELLQSQATADDDALGLVARLHDGAEHHANAAPALPAAYLTALRRYLDD